MIIILKSRNNNQMIIKALSILSLVIMFYLYYQHMSTKFSNQQKQLVNNLEVSVKKKKVDKSKKYENVIYKESVIIVDLIEQKNIQSIKILKNKLYIVCDYNTDIEPLLIRYGVNALIKNTSKNIKIAIDLKNIVENKYEK